MGIYLQNAMSIAVGQAAAGNTITGSLCYGLYASDNFAGSVVQRNAISGNGGNVVTSAPTRWRCPPALRRGRMERDGGSMFTPRAGPPRI